MKKAGGGGRDDPGVMTDLIYVADHEPFGNAIEDQALPLARAAITAAARCMLDGISPLRSFAPPLPPLHCHRAF